MQNRLKFLLKEPVFILSVSIFIVLVGWWYYLQPFNLSDSLLHSKYIWGSLYQILALIGGIYGIFQSKKWGGINSFLGRSILLFSLGLIFQCIGQSVYSYYNLYAQVEAPYPSLGDFGYFGSVILYILGVLSLSLIHI